MKKRILILLAVLFSLTACGAETPEDALRKAYQKQEDAESFTLSGTMELDMGTKIPVDMRVLVDRNDRDDPSDDEAYLDIDLRTLADGLVMKIWVADKVYIDAAGERYTEELSGEIGEETGLFTGQFSAEDLIARAESASLNKENGKKVITLKMKEDIGTFYLEEIVLTIGTDGRIEREVLTGSVFTDGEIYPMKAEMVMSDYDRTVIPVLDRELFTSDTVDGGPGEDSYIDLLFDDGLEIILFLDDGSMYSIVYDDEGYIVISDIYETVAEGMFTGGDYARSIRDQILNRENGYELIAEEDKDDLTEGTKEIIGYSTVETDDFYEGETFMVTTFGDKDLGVLLWSYVSEDEFRAVTGDLNYLVIVDGE